jgi:hypothetical protein
MERPPVKRWMTAAEHWLYANQLKSTDRLSLPDFLGIGAQKSGTSWLHLNLRQHPDAFLPELKELHYFDQRFQEPLATYAKYFSPARNRIKGEITPAYAILPVEHIRYIRAVMPNLRLIFLMRNPIERAWSHAVMILVTQAGREFADVSPAEFIEHFRSEANLSRGDYQTVIENWLSVFDSEQLYLGLFERIADRPIELLREIFRHLGLREDVNWEEFPYREKVYAGPGIAMPAEYRGILRDLYAPKIRRLRGILGPCVDEWLLDSGSQNV